MPVFICRWQNGDFSAVYAANKEEAIIQLDEVGNAEMCDLFKTSEFMVHFRLREALSEDWEQMIPVELEDFGDATTDMLCEKVYPVYNKAVMEYDCDWQDGDHPSEQEVANAEKILSGALAAERKRNWGYKQEQISKEPEAADLQRNAVNLPKAVAERVVRDHRRRRAEQKMKEPPLSDKLQ